MKTHLTCLLIFTSTLFLSAQCSDTLPFSPTTEPGTINWAQFPDFELPFTLVYQGPRGNDTTFAPLHHGFSHLAKFNGYDHQHLAPAHRAMLLPRIAFPVDAQPWGSYQIPWNNDPEVYESHWNFLINHFFSPFYDFGPDQTPYADILVADIESSKYLSEIPGIKDHPDVPDSIQQLGDLQFIAAYRSEMVKRYSEALHYLKNATAVSSPRISSYSDTPIRRYWEEIGSLSWNDWTTSTYPLNYLTLDTLSTFSYGPVYDIQNFLTPSAYYFYDYPDDRAPDYLAYLLFQIEANRSRSDKDQVPFVWLNYHNCCTDSLKNIQPFMAEATAIFPLMSGAAGIWVWDHRKSENQTDTALLYNYEYFTKGLYRLSRFQEYFTDCHGFVSDNIAYNHFMGNTPVWRGVVQGNRILIAANNPYADADGITNITVQYKNWSTEISLQGNETYLCDHVWAPENQSMLLEAGQALLPADTDAAAYLWSTGEVTAAITPTTEGTYIVTVTDSNGCDYQQVFEVMLVTGESNISGRSIAIVDNVVAPGADIVLRISGDATPCRVHISDTAGRLVQEYSLDLMQDYARLPLEPLPGGMYYLALRGADWTKTMPFVVQ